MGSSSWAAATGFEEPGAVVVAPDDAQSDGDKETRRTELTAFDRGVERVYQRLGRNYLRVFRVSFVVFGVLICPLAAALFSFYQPMSGDQFVRMTLFAALFAAGSLTVAVLVTARMIVPVDAWLGGARDGATAAAAWRDALRAPFRVLPTTLAIAVGLAAVPLTVYTAIEFGYSVGTASLVLATILMASLFPTVLATIGTEVALRPLVRETAAAAAGNRLVLPAGVPLRRRLLLVFPLISLISAMFVSVISAGTSDTAFQDLGPDVIVALLTTGLSTALIAYLVTQALMGPVDELVSAIRRFGDGDFATRATVTTNDEFGVLSGSFNLMADELQRSREALISAREEERRRLSRDLHDGLGPSLAGIAIQLGAARTYMDDAPRLDETITRLEGEARRALADVRVLVRGLRPPALDELGLASAIEKSASSLSSAWSDGGEVAIRVEVDGELGDLPAAAEVAAFHIAREAITNTVRHSSARRCTVLLRVAEEFEIEVTDDGLGLDRNATPGVGLHSMLERATELGGALRVEPVADGGTRISVRLPMRVEGEPGRA